MTEQEKIEQLKAIQDVLDKFKSGFVFVEQSTLESQLAEQKNSIDTEVKAKYDELMKISKEQGEAIRNAMESARKADSRKPIEKALEAHKDAIQKMAESGLDGRMTIELKDITAASFLSNTTAQDNAYISEIPQGNPFILAMLRNVIPVGAGSGGTVRYWYQKAVTNKAAFKAENGTVTASNYTWEEGLLVGKEIQAHVKVSRRQLYDMTFTNGQVNSLLNKDFALKLNDKLINGLGAGNDPYGLKYYATELAFATADKVKSPNLVDVVNAIDVQATEAMKDGVNLDMGFCKKRILNGLKNAKDDFGQYIFPYALGVTYPNISGVTVMSNELSGTDELIVMDSSKVQLYAWENMVLDIFEEGTDRRQGIVTMTITGRYNLLVQPNDTPAVIKVTDLAEAIAGIEEIGA